MSEQASYDIMVPGTIRNDKQLSFKEQLLYAEIRGLCKLEGYCWASNSFLAHRMNVTIRTVQRWLKHLDSCGHINIELPKEANNSRKITLTEIIKGGDRNVIPHDRNVAGGRQKCHPNNISKYIGTEKALTEEEIRRRDAEAEAELMKIREKHHGD